MHIQAGPQEEKKNFGKVECIYVDACQEEDYRVCSNGGPLIFLPVLMMQLWLVSGDNFFMTFKEIPQQIRCNSSLEYLKLLNNCRHNMALVSVCNFLPF